MAAVQKYLFYVSYVGSHFRGSQIQRNVDSYYTVQGLVKEALDELPCFEKNRSSHPSFSSRTDSGVHALKAAFHLDMPKTDKYYVQPLYLLQTLNKYFFKKGVFLRVLDIVKVPEIFNARFSAIQKTYLYRIGVPKNSEETSFIEPLHEYRRTYFVGSFDAQKASDTIQLFVGEKDFKTFEGLPSKSVKKSTVCNIYSFTLQKAQPLSKSFEFLDEKFDYYHFICSGNTFLRYMVRRMVGVSIAVAKNIISLEQAKFFIDKPSPSSWSSKIYVVPSHGLYLADIIFNPHHLVLSDEDKSNKFEQSVEISCTNTTQEIIKS